MFSTMTRISGRDVGSVDRGTDKCTRCRSVEGAVLPDPGSTAAQSNDTAS